MTATVTLHGIATDIVGHYTNAAKSLVSAYRAASKRALDAKDGRYAVVIAEGVERMADGFDRAIELGSAPALKSLEAFARRTDWAKDMFVVDALRRLQMPAAKLSLEIAVRIDDAASALSTRAEGARVQPAAKPAAKKGSAKRTRRTA
ncbi:MAG TPA: hypothetical protein VMU47_00835 [Caldimonas sp.]|nr:hypothetical protein [Caldimonas sp.]